MALRDKTVAYKGSGGDENYTRRLEARKKIEENYKKVLLKRIQNGTLDVSALQNDLNKYLDDIYNIGDSIVSDYNARIGYDGYRGDATEWRDSISAKIAQRDAAKENLSKLSERYGVLFDMSGVDGVTKNADASIESILGYANKDIDHWAQWENEEAYNKWKAENDEYNKYLGYDAKAGQEEIDRLREYASRAAEIQSDTEHRWTDAQKKQMISDLSDEYRAKYMPKKTIDGLVRDGAVQEVNPMLSRLEAAKTPSIDTINFKSLLDEKIQYHSTATEMQRDYEYYHKELPDLEKFASIGTNADVDTVGNVGRKVMGGAGAPAAVYDDPDNVRLAATALAIHNGQDGGKFAERAEVQKYLKELSDDDFKRLAYYIGRDQVEGTNETAIFLKALEKQINLKKGENIALGLKGKPLLQRGYGFVAGLDNFVQGLSGIGSNEKKAPSAVQYASKQINEDLGESGFKYYNAKTGEWELIRILDKTTGQLAYELNNTTGNMLPSILVSAAIELAMPTVGEGAAVFAGLTGSKLAAGAGALTLGASAGGNAKQEMLNLGYDNKTASAYGLMVGASEAGLSYVLSGIPGLRGSDGVFSALGKKVVTKIDHALAKAAITLGADMLDEGLEEGIQTVLEPWFKSLVTGVDFEAPDIDEVLYSSLLGALSAAGFGGGKIAVSKVADTWNAGKIGKSIKKEGNASTYIEKGLSLEGTKASEIATKLDATKQKRGKVSNVKLGRLAQNMSASQMSAAFQSELGEDSRELSDTLTDIIKGKEVGNKRYASVLKSDKALSLLNEALGTDVKAENSVREARESVNKALEATAPKDVPTGKISRDRVVKSLSVNLETREAESFADTIVAIANGDVVSDKKVSDVLQNRFARNALNKYLERSVENKFTAESQVNDVRAATVEGDFSRKGQAVMYGATFGMKENGIKGLVSVATSTKGDVSQISQAYNAVYQAGKQGKAITEAKNPYLNTLTPIQRNMAYEYGVMDSMLKETEELETSWETEDEAIDEAVDKAVDKAVAESVRPETITPVQEVSKEHQKLVDSGKKIGIGVEIARIQRNGKDIDSMYIRSEKRIIINPNSANPSFELFKHELTHFTETNSGKYSTFATDVTDSKVFKEWRKGKGFDTDKAYMADKIAQYRQVGKELSDSQAQQEMIANFVAEVLYKSDKSINRFVDGLSSSQKKSFKTFLSDLIEWFKGKVGRSDEVAKLEKAYAELFKGAKDAISSEEFVDKTKDTSYNFAYAEQHKNKLAEKYTKSAAVSLETLQERYDKILEIWDRIGGSLNSKFLKEWDSKVGKDRAFTIFKAQSGYKYNIELSSMCKKGVPLFEAIDTIVKEEAMKALKVDKLGKAEKEILYDLLKSDGFDIPCAICYVEQARQREGVIIDAFLNGTEEGKVGWDQVLSECEAKMKAAGVDYTFPKLDRLVATDKYVPTNLKMSESEQNAFYEALKEIANREITKYNDSRKDDKKFKPRKLVTSLTPAAVADCFKGNISSDLKIFKVLFQNPNARFTIDGDLLYSSTATHNLSYFHNDLYSLFNQQGGVSGYKTKQGNVVYWGDILDKKWEASKLRKEGGIRYQSNSDSQMYTLLDQVQMFIDLTAKGFYLQSYTKVLSYIKLLGLSKGKINASLIPKVVVYRDANGDVDVAKTQENAGLDENGNPIYDDFEGINHAEAFMLLSDPEYSKNVGGVCIGYSDKHIRALLDDSRVQLIIGFHDKTNNPDKRYRGARYSKNYNGINEAVDSEGKTVHIGFNQFAQQAEKMFTKDGESFTGTATHNGKEYTANDIPRLTADLYLEMCEKKGYTPAYNIEGVVDHKNYYKLLADFSLYDSLGNYAPHQKVEYNMPYQVPYLDENGHKRWMKSETYIRTELEKELKVRDDIAEKLADKSEAGLIPRFIKAVNGENTLDNADNAEYNEDDAQYAYYPTRRRPRYLSNISDATLKDIKWALRDVYGDVQNAIADEIAVEVDGIVYIVDSGRSDGAITARPVEKIIIADEEARQEFIRRTNYDALSKGSVSDGLSARFRRKYAGRGQGDRRSQIRQDIQADNGTPGNNQDRVSEDIGNDGGTGDLTSYSYTPKAESKDELLKQYEDGVLTREEYLDLISGKTPKSDPVSLANMHPEDYDMNTTPDIKRKTGKATGDGERRTYTTLQKSSIFDQRFKDEVKTDEFIKRYSTITNEDTLLEAARELDEGGHDGVQDWLALKPERASVIDTVKGFILLDRYQRAGNVEGQVRVAQKLAEMGTAAGQTVQSFSILRRLDSAAMMLYAQKTMDDAYKLMVETKSKKWLKEHGERFKLTAEDIDYIFNRTVAASVLPDGRSKDVMIAQIAQRLQDKLPPEKGQTIKAVQRISMLLNPKTIIRNVLGNVTITPVHWISDWVGTAADALIAKKTGVRTTNAITDARENVKAFGKGAFEAYDDFVKKINTQLDLDRFEVRRSGGKSFNENQKFKAVQYAAKMANAMDRFTSFTLAIGDRPFYEYWFVRSINGQMKANKVDVPTADMIEIATQEALQRTWQDNNNFTALATNLKKVLNGFSIGGYGLGDVFLKFTKTPANLCKAIYDFSPAAFVSVTADAVKFKQAYDKGQGVAQAQKRFVKTLSNAVAGTLLYVGAVALFGTGRLTGGADEDKDVAAFEKWVQGVPAYSIKVGGRWFSYEWMQPIGSVAAIVSDYMDAKDEDMKVVDRVVEAMRSGGNVLFNQSFMQSFQTLFTADNFVDGLVDAIVSDPSAFIPQISSQFANLFDDTRRTTYDKSSAFDTFLNSIKYKIPGLRNTLTEDVDVFGRDVPNSQSNVGNAFLNPANTYVDTSDAVTDHVYGLYKRLGNKNMIPAKAPYSITVNEQKINLSTEERAEYQRIMGSVAYKLIEALLQSEVYNSYSDVEKEKAIKDVYSYANKVALANYNAEVTFDNAREVDPFIKRDVFEEMTDEEKQELWRRYALSAYDNLIDTDESGVIAYFENQAVTSAVRNATIRYDADKAKYYIDVAVENAKKYSNSEDAEKEIKSSIKSYLTTYWKPMYQVAYSDGDKEEMKKIQEILEGTGLYGNGYDTKKTLKKWLEP